MPGILPYREFLKNAFISRKEPVCTRHPFGVFPTCEVEAAVGEGGLGSGEPPFAQGGHVGQTPGFCTHC